MGNQESAAESQSKTEKFKQELKDQLTCIYPPPSTQIIKTESRKPTKPTLQNFSRVKLNAKPVQETTEDRVNAFDGRTQVLTTSKWPYSVHGLVSMKFNNDERCGTGIMIGPNIVLTAGHNIYNYKLKAYAELETMQFFPGMNGQVPPFGAIEVGEYFVSPNYIQEEKEDYGILVLKEPVGEVTGYFGLACLESEEIKKKRINVTGYPGDKVASRPNIYEMWGMEGEVAHIDKDRGLISYMIDTDSGQSGSGVWYQEGEEYYVCGVHILGSLLANKATLITRAMYQQIHTWLQQVNLNGKLFELRDREKLDLDDQEINTERMSILMRYSLENLSFLELRYNKIGDEAAKLLAQNISWVNLSKLDLSQNQIGAEGAKALAQNTSWTNLSQLNLSSNSIGAEGAKGLAQNTSWTNLSQLNLTKNNIGAEGAKGLAQNTSWTNLSQLNLTKNNIGAEGAKVLAQNTSWIKLSELYLSSNNIDAQGAQALAQNASWTNLSQLDLDENKIGAEGAKGLAQNASWINLSKLDLSRNDIHTEGAKGLAQNTSWINLSKLELQYNKIDAEGAKSLTQNTSWSKFLWLDLMENNTGGGVEVSTQNPSWLITSGGYRY